MRSQLSRILSLFALLLGVILSPGFLSIPFPASAQSEPPALTPLVELLSLIPAPDERGIPQEIIAYADYRAMEVAAGLSKPADFADFQANYGRAWFSATLRMVQITSGPMFFPDTMEGMRDAVGFDFFALDRYITVGSPPATLFIGAGMFDPQAIARVYTDNGYAAAVQQDGITLWQRADGLDGTTTDLMGRNTANPFGGQLGRKEGLLVVGKRLIADSADDGLIESTTSVAQGEAPSLLEANPAYDSLLEALSATLAEADAPQLLQASVFTDGMSTQSELAPLAQWLGGIDPSDSAGLEAWTRAAQPLLDAPLPAYEVAAITDWTDSASQHATIALVYPDHAAAKQALISLQTRIELYHSTALTMDQHSPFADLNASITEARIVDLDVSSVASVTVSYPLQPDAPGRLYYLWVQGIIRQQFIPLMTVTG